MANIWKIGSRWSRHGTPESSILSIFRRNNVVFIGADDEINNFSDNVKPGDYFAIADGYNVVAVAKAISEPVTLDKLKINVVEYEKKCFDYESYKDFAVGVRVKIVDLKEDERILYKKQGSFFRANKIRQKIIDLYENQKNKFSINAHTCTLLEYKNDYEPIFDNNTKFIIPVYQRPYSWGEKEIEPFLSDLLNNYCGEDKNGVNSQPMFIGTMQLSEKKYIDKKEYEQEIIDGQQRLTTLLILLKILNISYPDCAKLSDLNFNCLESRVNKEQNNYINEFFNTNKFDTAIAYNKNNTYFKNAFIIQKILTNLISDECIDENDESIFNIDKFCDYIFSSIYFVVIETYAGLSKTIKIFNAINTTGLDLNGGDLFKIRMYEYLTEKKNEDEGAFEKISEIYQLIDEKNNQKLSQIRIQEVLDIYKDILIAKYDLPNILFKFGWETFYDRLFDVLLGVKDWEHFGNALKARVDIQLDEIKTVIDRKFELDNSPYTSADNMFAFNLIRRSRYSRYFKIIYLFMYKYKLQNMDEDIFRIMVAINKILFIYSIIYAKAINEIHSFMYGIQRSIIKDSIENVIKLIDGKFYDLQCGKRENIENILSGNIVENARKKNLICFISAFLDEIGQSYNINEIEKNLFNTKFDIEHIHANADSTIIVDKDIQNSIGNLVMLEENINRSVKHAPFLKSEKSEKCKKEAYSKSIYVSVKRIAEKEKWEIDEIQERNKEEVNKIMQYLFE